MIDTLSTKHVAQLCGDAAVVVTTTIWSVLVFSIVAGVGVATLKAVTGLQLSVKGAVAKVAFLAFVIAGSINVWTSFLHQPKWIGGTLLSAGELTSILLLPVFLVTWGLTTGIRRMREKRRVTDQFEPKDEGCEGLQNKAINSD